VLAGGGDLIDLVDVDDSVLREVWIVVRCLVEITDQILDVIADIAGFRKFGRVGFDKRNTNQFRDRPHQVGFADTGRPE